MSVLRACCKLCWWACAVAVAIVAMGAAFVGSKGSCQFRLTFGVTCHRSFVVVGVLVPVDRHLGSSSFLFFVFGCVFLPLDFIGRCRMSDLHKRKTDKLRQLHIFTPACLLFTD